MNLAANHTEYWKTFRRGDDVRGRYTVGFHWFHTFPTSRRLRFPVGWNKPVKMGWVPLCQREIGETVRDRIFEVAHGLWSRELGWKIIHCENPPQHFDKHGNEIKGDHDE